MTPSFIGLIASIAPGVLPSIFFASWPTAITVDSETPFSFLRATTEGSFKTTLPSI